VGRLKVIVFVHVHRIGQPDLMMVAGAFLLGALVWAVTTSSSMRVKTFDRVIKTGPKLSFVWTC